MRVGIAGLGKMGSIFADRIKAAGHELAVWNRTPEKAEAVAGATTAASPADLASRAVPAQTAAVDGKSILARAQLPTRKDKVWDVELAPLTRMEAWKVPPIKNGDTVALVGFTFQEEKGDPVVRVEYLFVGGRAYGLRSGPA